MQIVPLADRLLAIPIVARWYHDEWGYMHPNSTAADIEANLATHIGCTNLPQAYVAVSGEEVIGAAELKLREVKELCNYEHWLGGVYVSSMHRGIGVASKLARYVANKARNDYGVISLYLQTEKVGGGLYKKLGWSDVTRINYDSKIRYIMVKELQ